MGSVPYAAPELFKDGLVIFDKAVDVYAIGAIAYRLAMGTTLPSVDKRFSAPIQIPANDFGSSSVVADLLTRALDVNPERRPTAGDVRDACARELLRDRHRGLLVHQGTTYTIDAENRNISLRVDKTYSLEISYNGLEFIVTNQAGGVLRNNSPVEKGDVLRGSCVFTFGGEFGPFRVYVPFDISHPEVVRIGTRLVMMLAQRYEILSDIGEGGMQVVSLANDLVFRRHVAIKRAKSKSAVKRFARSAKLSASINHPKCREDTGLF